MQLIATKITLLLFGLGLMSISVRSAPLQINSAKSSVRVAVTCTIDSFVGTLEKYLATIDVEPRREEPDRADVSFDFADLATGDKSRDEAMRQWLEYDSHRTATFHLTGWKSEGTRHIAVGQFSLHGVQEELQMPVTIAHDGANWTIDGTATFDYRDFKLSKIRKALLLTVSPQLKVSFHLVARTPTSP